MESPEHEAKDIRLYMAGQAPDEEVTQLEKMASERVMGERHDVWDVHTDKGRWWVVTNMTNLYPFDEFRSMDYVLSFHIGLMARMIERDRKEPPEESQRERLAEAWRRFGQAVDAYNAAEEAEEFQAVAMRLRECLLSFVRDVADEDLLREGEEAPHLGDFIQWSERIAQTIARGRLRTYLRSSARNSWELVNSLTHDTNAARFDAEITLDATAHILGIFGLTLIRHERGVPERCPECGSYRVLADYRPELGPETPYVTMCAACGWEVSEPTPDGDASSSSR